MPFLKNPKHELFAQARAQGSSADEAYVSAGYKPHRGNAARLSANESVQARVAEFQKAAAEKAGASVEGVLMRLWAIAIADPAELVEYQVGCCRYCWGKRFRYQETAGEQARRLAQFERDARAAAGTEQEDEFLEFNLMGGAGYNATRAPNPACPECFGRGEGQAIFKDTRKASPAARILYSGVKVTKEGQEVRMHDQVSALTKVGQHLGMFVDRKDVKVDAKVSGVNRIERVIVRPAPLKDPDG